MNVPVQSVFVNVLTLRVRVQEGQSFMNMPSVSSECGCESGR